MAQSGFTPILTYASNTASAVPLAGNLANSANGAELAVNTADRRLFVKNSGGTVVELGNNPSIVTNGLGAAATPSYTFSGDINTGMWSPAADTLAWSNNGAETMRLSASGNLGIGANSPAERLDVAGNARSTAWIGRANGSAPTADCAVYRPADNTLGFSTANTERVRIDSSGNLGIGTTSPGAKLDVNGNVNLISTARLGYLAQTDTSTVAGVTSPNYGIGWGVYTGMTGAGLGLFGYYGVLFSTAGAERARFDNNGNLGIGTTTPAQRLHVNGAGSTYIRVSSTNAGTGSGLLTSNATNAYIIGAGAASGGSGLEFRDDTNAATRMVLTSGGNLGIGTTSVSARLHVSGNALYTIPVSFAGAAGNASWTTGFGSQAVNASILATDSVIGASVYSVSDKRLKTNITPLPSNAGLDFVKAVDPVSFDWKTDNSHDTGFIAQSLMSKGYGHLVSAIPDGAMEEVTHEDGNVSPAGARFVVRYDSIVPILHAAIRDQQALIEALMARVTALEQA